MLVLLRTLLSLSASTVTTTKDTVVEVKFCFFFGGDFLVSLNTFTKFVCINEQKKKQFGKLTNDV